MIATYTLDEAKRLAKYYVPKIVGKTFSIGDIEMTVKRLEIVESDKDKVALYAIGHKIEEVIIPRYSIESAARKLNLLSPNEVLNNPSLK